MKRFQKPNINTPAYWDEHQTALDFGLRQEKYAQFVNGRQNVVELGCGRSQFLFRINNPKRTGLDFSPVTIETCRKEYPGVRYVLGDACDTPFQDGEFDAVVSGELIEHLERPELLLNEMIRICKKGGIVVLSTPKLEFEDPEHLWEFDRNYFWRRGFKTELVESTRFPGRAYIFAWKHV